MLSDKVRPKRRMMTDINVVPYIDVMLVLLVVFMVTAPLLTQGIKVDLPSAEGQAIDAQQEPIVLSVNASGEYFINLGESKTAKSLQDIGDMVKNVRQGKPNIPVFVEGDEAKKATEAGADAVGMEDLASKFKNGEDDYDVVIATPSTMKIVSPLGKILGPKGMMPNPKTGTVTKDVVGAVKEAKTGQIRYRADQGGIIHGRIGDLSYSKEQIRQNLEALLGDLKRNKPSSSKGIFIKKLSISSTMGVGVEIDLASLNF